MFRSSPTNREQSCPPSAVESAKAQLRALAICSEKEQRHHLWRSVTVAAAVGAVTGLIPLRWHRVWLGSAFDIAKSYVLIRVRRGH